MPFTPWVQTVGGATVPLGIAQGGTGSATGAGVAPWLPTDDGFLGFAADPATSGPSGLLVAGTAYLTRLNIRTPTLVSNLWVGVAAAGSSASTGTFCWIVSGATGAVLAQSADCAATFTGAAGWQPVAMTAPATVGGGTFPYAVILCNLATTQVTLNRMLNSTQDSAQAVTNLASIRWAQQAAFGTAVSAVTLASNARTAFSNVVGWT